MGGWHQESPETILEAAQQGRAQGFHQQALFDAGRGDRIAKQLLGCSGVQGGLGRELFQGCKQGSQTRPGAFKVELGAGGRVELWAAEKGLGLVEPVG
jgi:hypothetical protein